MGSQTKRAAAETGGATRNHAEQQKEVVNTSNPFFSCFPEYGLDLYDGERAGRVAGSKDQRFVQNRLMEW